MKLKKYNAFIIYKLGDKKDYLTIKIKAKSKNEAENKAQKIINEWNEDKTIMGKFYIDEVILWEN